MTLAVIPAKGTSTRLPGKNIRDFHGHPIIAYSIAAARHAAIFDQIVVSTDDQITANIATHYGAAAIWRPAALCEQDVGTQDVARHAAGMFPQHEHVCCIYATAPTIPISSLKHGLLKINGALANTCFFAVGVGIDPLQDAGQFYWSQRFALIDRMQLYAASTALIPIQRERICDINTEDDWQRALGLYEQFTEIKDPLS